VFLLFAGNTVSELGHTVFQGAPFLDSTDHGGFIYIRPSFQCLQKLILPPSPYLVALLVHRYLHTTNFKKMMYDSHEIILIYHGQFWLACRLPNTCT